LGTGLYEELKRNMSSRLKSIDSGHGTQL
jgi:hypothetical protein